MTYDEYSTQPHQAVDDLRAALLGGDVGAAETAGGWIHELCQRRRTQPLRVVAHG